LKSVNLDKKDKKSIILKMKDKSTACVWLDNILQGKYLWEFSDKNDFKKHSKGGKIVVCLDM
jgi:hypothetical protein